jgi:hypothetical protein
MSLGLRRQKQSKHAQSTEPEAGREKVERVGGGVQPPGGAHLGLGMAGQRQAREQEAAQDETDRAGAFAEIGGADGHPKGRGIGGGGWRVGHPHDRQFKPGDAADDGKDRGPKPPPAQRNTDRERIRVRRRPRNAEQGRKAGEMDEAGENEACGGHGATWRL